MWYKNAELLSNVTVNTTHKDGQIYVQSTVSLKRLQRSDLHSQLTCAASNTHLKGPLTAVVQVDMNCKYTENVLKFHARFTDNVAEVVLKCN